MIFDQTGVADMEAAGGGGRSVGRWNSAALQPRCWDEEAKTPPRREANGHRGHRAPEPQLHPGGTRIVPQIFSDVRARYVGPDRRSDGWSPGNVLEDTVARMQRDRPGLKIGC